MKKVVLPIALLVTTLSTVCAQDGRDDFHFGVKAGANLSNVYDENDNEFEADGKAGFAGGAFLSIPLGKFIGIQPEVLYSQRGFAARGSLLGNDYAFNRTLSYIDIPLQLSIKPVPGLSIVVGPQYSYLLNVKDTYRYGNSTGGTDTDNDTEDLRDNTLCLVGGFDINVLSFVIAPRVGIDMLNNTSNGSSTEPRYKNNWVQLTVGLRF